MTLYLLGLGLREQGIQMNHSCAPSPIEDASEQRVIYQTLPIVGFEPGTSTSQILKSGSITDGFVCKLGWSQDHLDLQKNVYIHLPKKILYAKLTYCDHPSKNVKQPDLRITKIWVQQK